MHDSEIVEVDEDTDRDMMVTNPTLVTMKCCIGYQKIFREVDHHPPNDLMFRMLSFRRCPDGKGKMVLDYKKQPAYFHSKDLGCLKMKTPQVECREVYMKNETFHTLTADHVCVLKNHQYWEAIVHNRRVTSQK